MIVAEKTNDSSRAVSGACGTLIYHRETDQQGIRGTWPLASPCAYKVLSAKAYMVRVWNVLSKVETVVKQYHENPASEAPGVASFSAAFKASPDQMYR